MNLWKLAPLLYGISSFLTFAHATESSPKPLSASEKNWGLQRTDSFQAWQRAAQNPLKRQDVVVAVVDTGADTEHPALRDSLWTNPGEAGVDDRGRNKANNGVDDDGNGFIDDVHGWNFVDNNNDLSDHHGHGTHVAGLIAPSAQVMILKYYDIHSSGSENLFHTLQALQYAIRMKAQIINYSGGGTDPNLHEEKILKEAQEKNILVVAAAGNEKSDNDTEGFYPASYGLSNIVSVTAIDQNGRVLKSSNYGAHSVDLAAPGKDILSALPGGHYGTMTGTSQATAFVSSAAALILSQHPEGLSVQELQASLTAGVYNEMLTDKTKSAVELNLNHALLERDQNLDAFDQKLSNLQGDWAEDFASTLDDESDITEAHSSSSGMR